jgi:hypothetical protein
MSNLTDDQILLLASTESGKEDPTLQEAAAHIIYKREKAAEAEAARD